MPVDTAMARKRQSHGLSRIRGDETPKRRKNEMSCLSHGLSRIRGDETTLKGLLQEVVPVPRIEPN